MVATLPFRSPVSKPLLNYASMCYNTNSQINMLGKREGFQRNPLTPICV